MPKPIIILRFMYVQKNVQSKRLMSPIFKRIVSKSGDTSLENLALCEIDISTVTYNHT